MNAITWALLGTLFTFSVTTLGALNVFWVKKEVTNTVQCVFLGFAGGVMIAASVWSLLLPGIERAEARRTDQLAGHDRGLSAGRGRPALR